jgi:serine/threonine protein kinase
VAKRYFLLSILGKGGMSVVYKAKDRLKRRILAVKTLR